MRDITKQKKNPTREELEKTKAAYMLLLRVLLLLYSTHNKQQTNTSYNLLLVQYYTVFWKNLLAIFLRTKITTTLSKNTKKKI